MTCAFVFKYKCLSDFLFDTRLYRELKVTGELCEQPTCVRYDNPETYHKTNILMLIILKILNVSFYIWNDKEKHDERSLILCTKLSNVLQQ